MKPDCMLLKSSITQVSHTSRPITPDTAAMRPAARRTSSSRLISFTGGSAHLLTMGGAAFVCGITALMGAVPPVVAAMAASRSNGAMVWR